MTAPENFHKVLVLNWKHVDKAGWDYLYKALREFEPPLQVVCLDEGHTPLMALHREFKWEVFAATAPDTIKHIVSTAISLNCVRIELDFSAPLLPLPIFNVDDLPFYPLARRGAQT